MLLRSYIFRGIDIVWHPPAIGCNPVNQVLRGFKLPGTYVLKSAPLQESYLLWRCQSFLPAFVQMFQQLRRLPGIIDLIWEYSQLFQRPFLAF